jgi:hypothetical protein
MPTMDWDFFRTLGIVGFLGLVIQLSVFVWENWFNTTWRGLFDGTGNSEADTH